MANTFEEANAATEELFVTPEEGQSAFDDVETLSMEQHSGGNGNNAPVAENSGQTHVTSVPDIAEAAEIASVAAETASQTAQENEMLKQQNIQLQEQLRLMHGTVEELSNQRRQEIVEKTLEPPKLDIEELSFADEDTRNAIMAKFVEDLSTYNNKKFMDENAAVFEFAKEGLKEKEKNEVMEVLSSIPELSGIREMTPQLNKIIASNRWLQSEDMPMDEKYINAYAIARGVNSINTPPPAPAGEPTAEELMEFYKNNPEFQNMVEKERIEQIKHSQQVPLFSASSGAVNAAPTINEEPKNFEEASRRTREMLGLM